jgi:hypothetical protein
MNLHVGVFMLTWDEVSRDSRVYQNTSRVNFIDLAQANSNNERISVTHGYVKTFIIQKKKYEL